MNSEKYVDDGYVADGYVANGAPSMTCADDSMPLKFLIAQSIDSALNYEELDDGEAGIFVIPASKKMIFKGCGMTAFLGGDTSEIESEIKELRNELVSLQTGAFNMDVAMTAPDGTVIANPNVSQNGTTFEFDVPAELSCTGYKVVVSLKNPQQ